MKLIKKLTAAFLVVFLLCETVDPSAFASTPSSSLPVPAQHGQVDHSSTPQASAPHIYFIQDAHDSMDAQKNIAALIDHGIRHWNVNKVFEEGYQGEVPVDKYFGKVAPEKRKRASDYYLDQLWVGGAEYARIRAKQKFKLIGAEDEGLYLENLRQYQEAAQYQALVANEIESLRQPIQAWAAKYWNREQKQIYDIWSKHAAGKTDFLNKALRLAELLQKKKMKTESAKFFLELKKGQVPENLSIHRVMHEEARLEAEAIRAFFSGAAAEAFQHLKQLELIGRLNQFEVGSDDFREVVEVLKAEPTRKMVMWIAEKSQKAVVLSSAWETLVSAAVEFYVTAEKRDESVLANLKTLQPEEKAILVFGGFHRENLTALLEKAGIGYTVITPRISEMSVKHRELYRDRMKTPIALQPSAAMAARSLSGFLHAELQLPMPKDDPFGVFQRSESRREAGSFVLDFLTQALQNYWSDSPPRHALQEKRSGSLTDALKGIPAIPEVELAVFEAGSRAFRGEKGFPFHVPDLTEDQMDRMVLWQQNAKAIRTQLGDRQPRKIDWKNHPALRANLAKAGYKSLDPDLARRFYDHLGSLYADRVKTKIHVAPFIFSLDPENVYYKEWIEEDDENPIHEYHRLAHLIFVHENQTESASYPVFTEYFLLDGAIYAYGTSWPAEEKSLEEYVMTFYVFQKEHGNPFGRGKYERSGKVFEERLSQMMQIYPGRRYTIPYNQYRPDQQGRTALSFYWRLGFRFDYPEANAQLERAMALSDHERYREVADLAELYSSQRYLLHFPPMSRSEARAFLKKAGYFTAGTSVGIISAWLTYRNQNTALIFLFGIYAVGDFLVNTVAFRLSSVLRGRAGDEIGLSNAFKIAFLFSLSFLPAFFYQPWIAQTVNDLNWQFLFSDIAAIGLKVAADLLITSFLYYGYLFLEEWRGYGTPWKKSFYSWKEFIAEYKEAAMIWFVADIVAYTVGNFAGVRVIPVVTSVLDLAATTLVLGLGYKEGDSSKTDVARSETRVDTGSSPRILSGYEGLVQALESRINEKKDSGFMLGIEGPSAIGKGFTSKIVMGFLALLGRDVAVLEMDYFLKLDDSRVKAVQRRLIDGGSHETEWDFWDETLAGEVLKIIRNFLSEGKVPESVPQGVSFKVLEGTSDAPHAVELILDKAWHRLKDEAGQNRYPEKLSLRRDSVVIIDGKYNARYESDYRQSKKGAPMMDLSIRLQDDWAAVREKYLWRVHTKYPHEIEENPGLIDQKMSIYDRSLAPSFLAYEATYRNYPDMVLNVRGLWRPQESAARRGPREFSPQDVILMPFAEEVSEHERSRKREAWRQHLLGFAQRYVGAYPGRYRLLKDRYAQTHITSPVLKEFRPNPKQILSSLMFDLLRTPVDESLDYKFWSQRDSGVSSSRLRAALGVYLTGRVSTNHALLKKVLKQRTEGKRDRRIIYMLSLAPMLFEAALNFGFERAGNNGGATYGDYEEHILQSWDRFDGEIESDFSARTGLKIEKKKKFMEFVRDPQNWNEADKQQVIQNVLNVLLGNFSPILYQDGVAFENHLPRRPELRADIGEIRYPEESGVFGDALIRELASPDLSDDAEPFDVDHDLAHRYARSESRSKLKEALFLGSAIYWGASMGGGFWAYAMAFGIVYSARILFHGMTFKDADGRIDYTNPWAPKYEWSLTDELEKTGSSEMVVRELGRMRPNHAWKIKARRDGKFVIALEDFVDWKKKIVLSRFVRVREWDENNLPDGWFDSDFNILAEKKIALDEPVDMESLKASELIEEFHARSEAREKFSAHDFKVAIAEDHPALAVFSRAAETQSWKYGEIQKNGGHNVFDVRLWGREDLKQGDGRASLFVNYEGYGTVTPYKFLNHLAEGLADETEVELTVEGVSAANKRRNIRTAGDVLTLLPKEKKEPVSINPKPVLASVSAPVATHEKPLESQPQQRVKPEWQLERLQELLGISVESWEQILNSRELRETSDAHLESIWRSWFALAPFAREKVSSWLKGETDDLSDGTRDFFKKKTRGLDLLIVDVKDHLKISENVTDASLMSAWTRLPENLYGVLNLFYGLSIPSETRPAELDQRIGLDWQDRLGTALDEIGKFIAPKPAVEPKVNPPASEVSTPAPPAEKVLLREVTKSLQFFIEVPADEPLASALVRIANRENERNLGEHGKLISLISDVQTKRTRYEVVLDDAHEESVLSRDYDPRAVHLMQALNITMHDQRTFQVDGKDIQPGFDVIPGGSTLFIFKEEPSARAKRSTARSEMRRSETKVTDALQTLHVAAMVSSVFQFIKKQNQEMEVWLPAADFLALSDKQHLEIEMLMALYPKLRIAIYGVDPRVLAANANYLALQRQFQGGDRVSVSLRSRIDPPGIRKPVKIHLAKVTQGPLWDDAFHFRYEGGEAGLLAVALLYSLSETLGARSELRLSTMAVKWHVVAQNFLQQVVYQRVFASAA